MKRITCSILIVLAASALYINSTDGVQAEVGVPVSDRVQAEMGVSVSDVKRFDAQEALTRLNNRFLLLDGQGKSSSTEAISRQDFVIFIVHTLNLNADSPPEVITFKDVPKGHYAFTAIEAAVQEGLVKGVGHGRFGLGLPLTRQDMAMLYQRTLRGISDKIGSGEEPSQQNLQEGSSSNDAMEAMALALELGLFRESGTDSLNPKGTVTREEAVRATVKWLESVESIDLNVTWAKRKHHRLALFRSLMASLLLPQDQPRQLLIIPDQHNLKRRRDLHLPYRRLCQQWHHQHRMI